MTDPTTPHVRRDPHVVIALDEHQSAIRDRVRDFAEEVVAPIAAERDRIQDPAQTFPWDVWREGAKRGIRLLSLPEEVGGGGMDLLGHCAALEELCAADAGVGLAYHQTWKLAQLLLKTPYTREQILPKFVADDDYLITLAVNEPLYGTDNVLPYTGADGGARTRAEQQPDGTWLINGIKHFMTNGGVAKGGFVMCRTDASKGVHEGSTAFYVEHDTPGFRFGHVYDKMGMRLTSNSELIFEDVRVPDEARVSDVGDGMNGFVHALGKLNGAATAVYGIGTARKALELTIERCRTRIQGGVPIADHQSTQLRIGDMWTDLELARLITWRAAWGAEYDPDHDMKLAAAAQLQSAEMVVRVCYSAMQLWGGMGYMREAPIEKLMRDALGNYHADGLNDSSRVRIARALLGNAPAKGYVV